MSAHKQNPKEKAAVLTLKLRADSGYEADAEYRISAEQWAEVLGICEGTRPIPAEPVPGSCPTCGSECNERDELAKAEREIERLGAKIAEPLNARLLEALRACVGSMAGYRREITMSGCSSPPCDAERQAMNAISAAETQQARPVRLTEAEIGQIDRQSREGIKSLMSTWPIPLARLIEDAVLERNGLKPQAKAYGPNNPARLRRPDESVDAYREAMGWPTNDQPQAKGD